jgi:aminocarboxymuconate-semialdehyde decarboxylase
VHDEETLHFLIKKMGIDNILLGSDYPFPLGELHPGKMVENSSLDDDEKEKILCLNAFKLFNISKEDFE